MGPSDESTPRAAMTGAVDLAPAAERIAASLLQFIGGRQVHLYRIDASGAPACVATAPDGAIEADVAQRARASAEGMSPGTPHVLDDGTEAIVTVALHARGERLGLAVVRRVADRHGGRAWAQSTLGAGSTFFIAIPAA